MKGFLVVFGAGIVTALAVMVVYRLSNPVPAGQKALTVKLVLASRDLELGTIIRDGDIVLTDWPSEIPVAAGASSHTQDFVGRGVITKIYAKEPILEGRLAPKGAGGRFAATIPQGMRAVAVPVNQVVGVAGFVVPGMHVDVLSSGTPPGAQGTVTRTILQNIEVLSAGQDFKKDAEGEPVAVEVVNLLVTPEQAQQLVRSSQQGTTSLVLRNPLDRGVTKTPGAALEQRFGEDKPADAPLWPQGAFPARPPFPRTSPAAASPA